MENAAAVRAAAAAAVRIAAAVGSQPVVQAAEGEACHIAAAAHTAVVVGTARELAAVGAKAHSLAGKVRVMGTEMRRRRAKVKCIPAVVVDQV